MTTLPRAVIFDWDNTLVDSWPAIAEAINQTRSQFGLQTWSLDYIQETCTRAARESFPEWFGDAWTDAYDFYYRTFDEVRTRMGIQKMRGAEALLELLKERGVPMFVVSNKRGDYLRHEAETLGWSGYFKALIGATDAPHDKPARDPVDMALAQTQIIPDLNVWFVGDSESDISCARNAGCRPILLGTAQKAHQLKVDTVFSDCQHLQTLLYKGV